MLLLFFSTLLHRWRSPGWCWTGMVRMNIFNLAPILHGNHSFFSLISKVSATGIALSDWKNSFLLIFAEILSWIFGELCQMHFLNLLIDHTISFWFIDTVNHFESTLYSWDTLHLNSMFFSSQTLLDLIC